MEKDKIKLLFSQILTLNDKEITILKMKYFENISFEDIGKHFRVTRERIRQIDDKIMEKLKTITYNI